MKGLECHNNRTIESANQNSSCEPHPNDKLVLDKCLFYSKPCQVKVLDSGCMVFNANGTAKQLGNGQTLSLQFSSPVSVKSRLAIIIQSADEPYVRILEASRYFYIAGVYDIMLGREEIYRQPPPYPSQCSSQGENTDNLVTGRYTRANCYYSCAVRKMLETCGTVVDEWKEVMSQIQDEKSRSQPNMNDTEERTCLKDQMRQIIALPPRNCTCPLPCQDIFFHPTFTKINDANNMWRFNIQYNSLREALIKEVPMNSIGGMLSTLGGLMGLLAGMSALSIVEIVVCVCVSLAAICYKAT